MGGVVRVVTEERVVAIAFDESNGVVGEVIDDEAVAPNLAAIVIEGRAEIVSPVTGGESVIFVEPAIVGMVGRLGAVVPFAERAGGITVGFEHIGDGGLVGVESALTVADAADARARVVAASEKLSPGRRADVADVEVIKSSPVASERIDVGGGEVGVAVDAQIAPTLIVGEDDDDVGLRRRRRANAAEGE